MTDEQSRRELIADMDREAVKERLKTCDMYYRLGFQGGLFQALDDALRSHDKAELIETLAARLAPTIGAEQ